MCECANGRLFLQRIRDILNILAFAYSHIFSFAHSPLGAAFAHLHILTFAHSPLGAAFAHLHILTFAHSPLGAAFAYSHIFSFAHSPLGAAFAHLHILTFAHFLKMYLVALSGGADSVCLLLTLLKEGRVGAAAHCNFHLRGEESNRDEAFVRQLCAEKHVPLYVAHFATEREAAQSGESIEMAARRLRYAWFEQLIQEHGLEGVAVGHHQEDNAETLLLNIVRGTGLQGLQGMQRMSYKQGFCIYRPLLSFSKADILAYLKEQGQPYVTDSTNADTHYRRNKIRHEVLPLLQTMNPQVVSALNQMAQHITEVNSVYQIGIKQLCINCGLKAVPNHSRYQQLSIAQLKACTERTTLLRELLAPLGFTMAQINDALQMRVGGVLTSPQGFVTINDEQLLFGPSVGEVKRVKVNLPSAIGDRAVTRNGEIKLTAVLCPRSEIGSLRCAANEAYFDADKLRGNIYLRGIEEADRFRPFGMKGSKLVSDIMTDLHCSRLDKLLAQALVDSQDEILWLVGYRTASMAIITNETKRVLKLIIKQ